MAERKFPIGINSWAFSLLLGLCLFLFFWALGDLPFYRRGEAREGLVVWEMVKTGNWILPIINGEYFPYKPPLYHWMAALVSKAAGDVDELTLRFPSALFATLGVLVIYIAGARLWNERTGRIAAIVLATNFEWWSAATQAQVDMTLGFFVMAALLSFYFGYQRQDGRGAAALLALGVSLALATLAKGPVGFVVPSLTIAVFLLLRWNFGFFNNRHVLYAGMVFLLVAGSWYAVAIGQGGWAFVQRQIVEENLGTASGVSGHYQPLHYYVPAFFQNLAPWSVFFPCLALFLIHRRHTLSNYGLLFPLVWLVTGFLFFSFSAGKRAVYILPLYPAAALLFGAWWVGLEEDQGLRRLTRILGYVLSVTSLLFLARLAIFLLENNAGTASERFFPWIENPREFRLFLNSLTPASTLVWTCVAASFVAALFMLWSVQRRKWDGLIVALAVIAAATTMLVKTRYYPVVAAKLTLKPFATRLREKIDPAMPLSFYNSFDYGTVFYSRRHIPSFSGKRQQLEQPPLLLMWEEDWKRLAAQYDLKMLDISEGRGPAGRHRLVLTQTVAARPGARAQLPIPGENHYSFGAEGSGKDEVGVTNKSYDSL